MRASVDELLDVCTSISMRFMLYQIRITYINFKTCGEYVRELERAQMDEQNDRRLTSANIFQLCWKVVKSAQYEIIR